MKDLFFLFTSSQLRHVLKLGLHPQKQNNCDAQNQGEKESQETRQNQEASKRKFEIK